MAGAQGVQVEGVDLPDSLDPGERATARIDMTNGSNFINPFNVNRCENGGNYGLLTEGVLVGPDGEEHVGETVCAEQNTVLDSNSATSEVTFEAPETDGTHRYEAFVRMAETGEESSRVSESIDVYGDEDDAPEDPPDDPDSNGAPDWIDGLLPGGGDVGSQVQVVLGLVLLIALLYSAGQLASFNVGGSA